MSIINKINKVEMVRFRCANTFFKQNKNSKMTILHLGSVESKQCRSYAAENFLCLKQAFCVKVTNVGLSPTDAFQKLIL